MEAIRRAQNLRPGAGVDSEEAPLAAPKAELWRKTIHEFLPFVATKERVVAVIPWTGATGSNLIRAFHRQTGQDSWQCLIKAGLEFGPVLGKDLVLIGTDEYQVVAFDLLTGEERWRASLDVLKRFISTSAMRAQVQFTVEGDRLFVATYGKGSDGEAAGKLYALKLATGERIWERNLARGAAHPPLAMGDTLLVGGGPWLYAFRNLPGAPDDGQELWKQPTESTLDLGIGVAWEGTYAFRAPNLPRVVDLKDGHLIWKGTQGASPFVDGTRMVWVEWGKGDPTLRAHSPGSEKRLWERALPEVKNPWIQDGLAILVGDDEILALNTETGQNAWRFPFPDGPSQAPFWIEGRILVWKKEGGKSRLHALDPKTGQPAWSFTVACKPGIGMIHADAHGILFPGKDGTLVCLQ